MPQATVLSLHHLIRSLSPSLSFPSFRPFAHVFRSLSRRRGTMAGIPWEGSDTCLSVSLAAPCCQPPSCKSECVSACNKCHYCGQLRRAALHLHLVHSLMSWGLIPEGKGSSASSRGSPTREGKERKSRLKGWIALWQHRSVINKRSF